jgi:hypothetical protein
MVTFTALLPLEGVRAVEIFSGLHWWSRICRLSSARNQPIKLPRLAKLFLSGQRRGARRPSIISGNSLERI